MKKNNYIKIFSLMFIIGFAANYAKDHPRSFENGFIAEVVRDTSVTDSLSLKSKKNRLVPLLKIFTSDAASVLHQKEIERLDYRSFGDLVSYFPFSFQQNLGYLGQPNHLNIMGLKSNNISFVQDGIVMNKVWSNSINPYDIQSEMIDSIIMISPVQSFLYSNSNAYQTIMMISKDKVERRPFSRLHFYQAPNDEGVASVYLNTFLFPKMILSSEITNMSVSAKNEYFNNDFSNWQIAARLRYLFSEKVNVIANYYYVKNQTELNGGAVDNAFMFDDLQSLPNYPNRFLRSTISQFSFNILADVKNSDRTDALIYFRGELDEFKQDKHSTDKKIPTIINNNKASIVGIKIIQPLQLANYYFEIAVINEAKKIKNSANSKDENISDLSLSAKASTRLVNFTPTIFGKILYSNSVNFSGAGASLQYRIMNSLLVNTGFSVFQKPPTSLEKKYFSYDIKATGKPFDFSVSYQKNNVFVKASYFNLNIDNYIFPTLLEYSDTSFSNEVGNFKAKKFSSSGLNFTSNFNFWKIEWYSNLNYFLNISDQKINSTPRYDGKIGIYYLDTMFNSNLDLKAGFNINFFANKSFVKIDFAKGDIIYFKNDLNTGIITINDAKVKANIIVDLYVSGIIQKNANVFLIIENLFDTKYFIVNNYPMYSRGLRLGVNWKLYN